MRTPAGIVPRRERADKERGTPFADGVSAPSPLGVRGPSDTRRGVMSRARIVFLAASLCTALGAFLRLDADSLATHWHPLGAGAWAGTTDPAVRQSYEAVGMAILAFGLALAVLAAA